MSSANFCSHCGNKLDPGVQYCSHCGSKIGSQRIPVATAEPVESYRATSLNQKKSGSTALLLCIFFGMLGVHRFYVGKYVSGFFMLCTGGLLGVWVIIDLTSIARNKFEDKYGNPLELIHDITPVKETLIITGSVMLWVALFFATIGGFLRYSSAQLISAADKQLSALHHGQIAEAYSYTTLSYQNKNSMEVFKNFVYRYPALMNAASSSFPERQIMGNKGYMRGVLIGSDGVRTPVAYELIKENDQWKIVNIQIAILPSGAK